MNTISRYHIMHVYRCSKALGVCLDARRVRSFFFFYYLLACGTVCRTTRLIFFLIFGYYTLRYLRSLRRPCTICTSPLLLCRSFLCSWTCLVMYLMRSVRMAICTSDDPVSPGWRWNLAITSRIACWFFSICSTERQAERQNAALGR